MNTFANQIMQANNNDNKNDNSKALSERYQRLLDKERIPWQPETVKKKPVSRIIWLLIIFGLLLTTQYLFTIVTQATDHLKVKPALKEHKQTTKAIPVLLPMPEFENVDSTPLNQVSVSDHESIIQLKEVAKASNFDRNNSSKILEQSTLSVVNEEKKESITDKEFLIVVESTTSKKEAITRAKQLSLKGYPSEVILSSTGYFGVILGRYNYETANTVIEDALASDVFQTKPYLMNTDRVIEVIDIEN